MWLHFFDNLVYLQTHINCSEMMSALIVLINLLGQLLGLVLVALRVWMLHVDPWQLTQLCFARWPLVATR